MATQPDRGMQNDSMVTSWREKREGVIAPEERLPWGQSLVAGLQHVVAMFGATVLAPILMGFDPNVAILFSGIGTLIFFVAVGGHVPSYLGSSFAFIGAVIAVTGYAGSGPNANLGAALGGIIAAGVVYTAIGIAVMRSGTTSRRSPCSRWRAAPSRPGSGCSPWSRSASSRWRRRGCCAGCRSCSAASPAICSISCSPT